MKRGNYLTGASAMIRCRLDCRQHLSFTYVLQYTTNTIYYYLMARTSVYIETNESKARDSGNTFFQIIHKRLSMQNDYSR